MTDGETAWLGNDFAAGASTTGGDPDELNNVENVFLTRAGDGTYTVRVDAANIIGAASANVDAPTWQDFALVISNAEVTSSGSTVEAPGAQGLNKAARHAPADRPSPRR